MPRTGHEDTPGESSRGAGGPRMRARELALATPADRDRYVDLLRAVAIVAVVLGHWFVAAVTVTDGRLDGVNLLSVLPWTHPLTWLFQVMPIFFLVGGYANAASWDAHRRRDGSTSGWVRVRVLRLLRPTAVLLVALVGGYGAAVGLGSEFSVARRAVWLAGISLWFLVVYLAVVVLAPVLLNWQRRWGPVSLIPLVMIVAAGDAARLATGSAASAAANYLVAWIAVHQLGVAWHDGSLTRARWPAYVLAGGGIALLVLLTGWGPYAVTMVGGAAPPELGNTAPPTLALLALASAQAGAALLLRRVAVVWLARPRVWVAVVTVNAVALTVYLWHMVPVVLVGMGLVATRLFPQPPIGSGAWLVLRIPWILLLAAVLLVLVAATARWETVPASTTTLVPSPAVVALGVGACLAGLTGLGVSATEGLVPALGALPVGELVLFAAGLALVRWSGRRPDVGADARGPASAAQP